jgi:glycosyltransferase involved in cell wall biosynthesis
MNRVGLATKLHRLPTMGRAETTPANLADRTSCEPSRAGQLRGSTAGVMIHANVEGDSDFAPETRALALRLAAHPFPTQIVPVQTQRAQFSNFRPSVASRDLQRLTHDHLDLAESVLYQSGAPTRWKLDFYGRCRVGRTAFGADRIPAGWAECCNALDEIWVPTEFHRGSFAVSGVEQSKILVVPGALDTQIFCPGRSPLQLPSVPARSFQFLAIADGMLAAGTDILVRAFVEEFAPDDDVALMIHCPPKQFGDCYVDLEAEVIALIETELGKDLEDVPTIALVMGSLSDEDRAGMLAAAHAFVHPARADATGQNCLEALACQVPVIATNWGTLDNFLTDQNSFPLATNGVVTARPDEDELVAGRHWAEPNLNHLRNQMREVFNNPKEAFRRAAQGRHEVVEKFDWSVVLPDWIRNFQRLLD